MTDTYVVIAKEPVPGRVKTRLTPGVSATDAAHLAAAALHDTLDVVDATPARTRLLAFDGRCGDWMRPGWEHRRQPDGGLDVRLAAALATVAGAPAVLVGMDTPQLTPGQLARFDPVAFDACLGPTQDGGYWCLGLRDPARAAEVIHGVPMSTACTFAVQLGRLTARGLRVQILDELVDVDTVADAHGVARGAPWTAFARAWTRITERAA